MSLKLIALSPTRLTEIPSSFTDIQTFFSSKSPLGALSNVTLSVDNSTSAPIFLNPENNFLANDFNSKLELAISVWISASFSPNLL